MTSRFLVRVTQMRNYLLNICIGWRAHRSSCCTHSVLNYFSALQSVSFEDAKLASDFGDCNVFHSSTHFHLLPSIAPSSDDTLESVVRLARDQRSLMNKNCKLFLSFALGVFFFLHQRTVKCNCIRFDPIFAHNLNYIPSNAFHLSAFYVINRWESAECEK